MGVDILILVCYIILARGEKTKEAKQMKYYAKHTNTETGKTMVFTTHVWTKKTTALKWANDFMKAQPNAKVVIISECEN